MRAAVGWASYMRRQYGSLCTFAHGSRQSWGSTACSSASSSGESGKAYSCTTFHKDVLLKIGS